MNYEKIIAEAREEFKMAEIYADMASQTRCKAIKLLESVIPDGSPAPSGEKKKGLSKADEIQLTTQRKKNLLRRAPTKEKSR